MSDNAKGRGSIAHTVIVVSLFLLVYVLSAGPVIKLRSHRIFHEDATDYIIMAVYFPVIVAVIQFPTFDHAMMWYLKKVWNTSV